VATGQFEKMTREKTSWLISRMVRTGRFKSGIPDRNHGGYCTVVGAVYLAIARSQLYRAAPPRRLRSDAAKLWVDIGFCPVAISIIDFGELVGVPRALGGSFVPPLRKNPSADERG
jgi:hypothetical protein